MRRDTATITIAAAAITLQDQATPSSLTGHSVQSRGWSRHPRRWSVTQGATRSRIGVPTHV